MLCSFLSLGLGEGEGVGGTLVRARSGSQGLVRPLAAAATEGRLHQENFGLERSLCHTCPFFYPPHFME